MTARPGYSPAPQTGGAVSGLSDAANKGWIRQIVDVVNRILSGKLNAVLSLTLVSTTHTTVVEDARIGPFSGLYLEPMTAHAAAAQYAAPYILVTDQKQGQATLSHTTVSASDYLFNLLIIG